MAGEINNSKGINGGQKPVAPNNGGASVNNDKVVDKTSVNTSDNAKKDKGDRVGGKLDKSLNVVKQNPETKPQETHGLEISDGAPDPADLDSTTFSTSNTEQESKASEPTGLDPADLNSEGEDPASLDPANLSSDSEDPASLDPADLNSGGEDPTSLDPASLNSEGEDPASLDPTDADPTALNISKVKASTVKVKKLTKQGLVKLLNKALAAENTSLKQIYLDSNFNPLEFTNKLQKLIKSPALLKEISSKASALYHAASTSESDTEAQVLKQEIKADIKESEAKQLEIGNQNQEHYIANEIIETSNQAAQGLTELSQEAGTLSNDQIRARINKSINSIQANENLSATEKEELTNALIDDLKGRGLDKVVEENIKKSFLDNLSNNGKFNSDDYRQMATAVSDMVFDALRRGDKKRALEILNYTKSDSPEAKKFFEELAVTQGLIKIAKSDKYKGQFDTLNDVGNAAIKDSQKHKFKSLLESLKNISAVDIPEDALTRVLKEAFKIDQKAIEASSKADQARAAEEKIVSERKQEVKRVNKLVENSIREYITNKFGAAYANNPILISILKYKGFINITDYIAAIGWEKMINDPRFKDTLEEHAEQQPEKLKEYILERIGNDDKQRITSALKGVFKIDDQGLIVDKVQNPSSYNKVTLKQVINSSWFLADPENKKDGPKSRTRSMKSSSKDLLVEFTKPAQSASPRKRNWGLV